MQIILPNYKLIINIMKMNFLNTKNLLIVTLLAAANMICAQSATLRPMWESDGAAVTSISENGEWACGSAFNSNDGAGFQSNASKWNLQTGERIYLVSEEDMNNTQSDAFMITNDGSLVVGQYLLQPAYHFNGEWQVLELTKGYTVGEARDVTIVNGDTIIVGRIFDGVEYQKVQGVTWINGVLNKLTDIVPREYQYNEDKKMAFQITNISEDGRVMLGAYDPFAWPIRKPFIIKDSIFTLLDISAVHGLEGFEANVDFFKEEKLSHNGNFVALSFFGGNVHHPVVYNIVDSAFMLVKEAPEETGAKAIDDLGNVYYAGPMTSGVDRKSFVSINGQATQVDNILIEKFGLTQEHINATCQDPDLTGSIRFIYDVSADGKTIIGSAGYGTGEYNWVLKLQCPLTDTPIAVENVVYNNNIAYYANGCINVIGSVDHIEIYNLNGQLVETQEVASGNNVIPTNLRQGVYIVKIYNNKQISTNKIIIK